MMGYMKVVAYTIKDLYVFKINSPRPYLDNHIHMIKKGDDINTTTE